MGPRKTGMILFAVTLMSGCEDQLATETAIDAANRQAQQNNAMARLNEQIASGTRSLVEADASARKEMIAVYRELQSERSRLDVGWSDLEEERQRTAASRRTESFLVAVAPMLGGVVLAVVLIGFCWHAVAEARRNPNVDAELCDLLIQDAVSEEPCLSSVVDQNLRLENADGAAKWS